LHNKGFSMELEQKSSQGDRVQVSITRAARVSIMNSLALVGLVSECSKRVKSNKDNSRMCFRSIFTFQPALGVLSDLLSLI